MADIAISCEGVWKSYRIYHQRSHSLKEKVLSRRNLYEDFWALRGVDLEIESGSTTGLIGRNGSGKSTMLKTMARVLTPNRGRVEVRGTVSPLLELGTGFHPELTGRENVFLGGSLLGQTRRDIQARYDGIVEFAGIESFMDIPVKNYSSGMYARLAFALAISVDPEILIVDEVLSVGDFEFQERCHDHIDRLRRDGRTIVLVSHDVETIRRLCARAVWVEQGTIRLEGLAHEVVASYLGETPGEGVSFERTDAPDSPKITSVSLTGPVGPTSTFVTGDSLSVAVGYRTRSTVLNASCAVSCYCADNDAYVFGQLSSQAGLPLTLCGDGEIRFNVPALPLLAGRYEISVALLDETLQTIFDWQERRQGFVVLDNPAMASAAGMVHVAGRWQVAASSAVA